MKILAITVAAYNLAETTRMVEIAKEAKEFFDIRFITYGGEFESLIKEEGFEIIRSKPEITKEKLKELKSYLNGDKLNTANYYNRSEIEDRVKSEIAIFKELKPVAVMAGWNLTVGLSSRVLGIPYINVLHSTSITEYYEKGLQTLPDVINFKFLEKIIAVEKRQKMFNKRILNNKVSVKHYNAVAKTYGIGPFDGFIDFIEGEHVFLADIPEWVNHTSLRKNVHHIGPLPAKLNVAIPDVIKNMKKDKKIIFFAMGSSGKASLIKEIVEGFKDKPYRVIAPIKSLLGDIHINVPDNVIVTGFIPADKVNSLADVAVIHGGQNTVMNACISKTPFVGIGMHVEQQANIDACVKKGFAIRLSKKYVTSREILDSIDDLLKDKNAKRAIDDFSEKLLQWNGPKNAAKLLNDLYGR